MNIDVRRTISFSRDRPPEAGGYCPLGSCRYPRTLLPEVDDGEIIAIDDWASAALERVVSFPALPLSFESFVLSSASSSKRVGPVYDSRSARDDDRGRVTNTTRLTN